MFIQIEKTPNPNTLKFLPGVIVSGDDKKGVTILRDADQNLLNQFPVTQILFQIGGVESVMMGYDFISITKKNEVEWYTLKTLILSSMMDFMITGAQFNAKLNNENDIHGTKTSTETNLKPQVEYTDELTKQIVKQIEELIETRVRPAVQGDGGDIEFQYFKDGVVYVQLRGACQGCPSSQITLKNGIENMLKHYVPEVIEVRDI